MPLFHVIDNALASEQVDRIKSFAWENAEIVEPYDDDVTIYCFKPECSSCMNPIVDIASNYHDLAGAKYREMWEYKNFRPRGWHYNYDEILAKTSDKKSFPLCATYYYLDVADDIEGGRLTIFDPDTSQKHYIEPVSNRLVVVNPGVFQRIEKLTGKSHTVLCSLWSKRLGEPG